MSLKDNYYYHYLKCRVTLDSLKRPSSVRDAIMRCLLNRKQCLVFSRRPEGNLDSIPICFNTPVKENDIRNIKFLALKGKQTKH